MAMNTRSIDAEFVGGFDLANGSLVGGPSLDARTSRSAHSGLILGPNMSTEKTKTAVLIVGAGPTGLMMAGQLARFGIPFRLVGQSASMVLLCHDV